jgi:hypothetical protein
MALNHPQKGCNCLYHERARVRRGERNRQAYKRDLERFRAYARKHYHKYLERERAKARANYIANKEERDRKANEWGKRPENRARKTAYMRRWKIRKAARERQQRYDLANGF